jgi:putative ABC transport system permease protein
MAWSNLFYNIRRTVLMILLIAVALCSVILYRGYVAYSREGMKLGFIERSGNLQIAIPDFWKFGGNDQVMEAETIDAVYEILNGDPDIKQIEPVLDFSGIIGTEAVSRIFWGKAYENPYNYFGVVDGTPLFPGGGGFVVGSKLAETLDIYKDNKLPVEEIFVNIMASLGPSGLSLGSFAVSGVTDTGIPQNDEGLVIASRSEILDFFGFDNTATYIQVYLYNDKKTGDVEKYIRNEAETKNIAVETRNWRQLNPGYSQINTLNEIQCSVFSVILCILIFISITQALSTALNERLSEFGTLEAIGLKKKKITALLVFEVLFLSQLGLCLGIVFAYAAKSLVAGLNIMLTFPGYSTAYPLQFFLLFDDIAGSALFIFAACVLAMVSPVRHILHNTVIRLIYRLE